MEFEYEISADDYADASVLHLRLSPKRYSNIGWFVAGAALLAVAINERDRGASPILLGAIGTWWIWGGLGAIFPIMFRPYYRRYYKRLKLTGQKYRASIDEGGFQVAGENRTWNHRWAEVSPKGEDGQVFMLFANGTLFIFAKRYLADEQQETLRILAGLSHV